MWMAVWQHTGLLAAVRCLAAGWGRDPKQVLQHAVSTLLYRCIESRQAFRGAITAGPHLFA